MNKIQLGDEVKHKFTGVRGIAVSRTNYMSGCNRIAIQPRVKKDGSLGESYAFDEPEIEITKKRKFENIDDKVGGFKPEVKHYLK